MGEVFVLEEMESTNNVKHIQNEIVIPNLKQDTCPITFLYIGFVCLCV